MFLAACAMYVAGYAQPQGEGSIQNQFAKSVTLPNSPEAEAFSKYGDVDVNLHAGTPNISVPLYTIKGRELDIPISLTYDASGIKVEQVATNVWIGLEFKRWRKGLSSNPRLCRLFSSISGNVYESPRQTHIRAKIADYKQFDGADGSIFYNNDINVVYDNVWNYYFFLREIDEGKIDIEPDYYTVNGMGLNETIWIDYSTNTPKPRAINNENVDVEWYYAFPGGELKDIAGWKITDEQGTQYFLVVIIYPILNHHPLYRAIMLKEPSVKIQMIAYLYLI